MGHTEDDNTGSSENANFENVTVNGNLANGVGHADFSTIYNFHGNQDGWMDSAQQDELFERMKLISKPDQRMRWYSREIGVDPKKKDIRVRGRNGYIPADELVHIAAGVGDCQAIDLLESRHTANVNIKHKDGWRPIHRAALGGQVESMNMLAGRYQVDVGARTDSKSKLALLHIAASQGRLEVIELLAGEKGPQIVKMGSLQPKVEEGHENVNPFPATEVDENVDTEYDPEQPTVRIINWIAGDPNVCSNLNWTPMHFAAMNTKRNVAETIRKLIDIGGHINAKDYAKWTPLHVAAWKGNWVAVQTLIEVGADVNARCNRPNGATPLHLAKLIREHKVEKKEMDKYSLVMVILKNHGARDRSSKYSPAPRLRRRLESMARKAIDNEWFTSLSTNFSEKETLADDVEATAVINATNTITFSAILKRPIWYYIMWQAFVLSLLLLITFTFAISQVHRTSYFFYTNSLAEILMTFSITFIWMSFLSIVQIVAHIVFSIKIGERKPGGTIAFYISFVAISTILWVLTCLFVSFEDITCRNFTVIRPFWESASCTSLQVADALGWSVLALHVFNIVTILKQVYKYFPPEVPEEKYVRIEYVGGNLPSAQANERHHSLTPSLAITAAARAWFDPDNF